ncbi:MAG: hypothetical protein ACXW11_00100 [Methylotenera sp.]
MNLIMDLVFYILSLWDKSSDDLLSEHRAYERKVLVYTVTAVILLIAAILVTPSIEMQPSDGIKYITYTVYRYIGLGVLVFGAFSFIASLWNMAELLYFRYKYGISD